jgi:hypothetical protein
MTWNKPGTFVVLNRISQDSGTEIIKTHKTLTVPGKLGRVGLYLRTTEPSIQKSYIQPVGSQNKQRLFSCTVLTV